MWGAAPATAAPDAAARCCSARRTLRAIADEEPEPGGVVADLEGGQQQHDGREEEPLVGLGQAVHVAERVEQPHGRQVPALR
jgi:hypothetical protein